MSLEDRASAELARKRLRAVDIRELLEMELPPREYLLSPILPKQGLAMIHAERGIGKTHLSLCIAYAVASGGPFLRWTAPHPAGVLFVDGEMPANVLRERLARIVRGAERETARSLQIITPDLNLQCGIPDLATESGQSAIDEHVSDDTKLIVVDNLSCLARSGKENEGESWLPIQGWALQHRAAGRSILFIHHSGKGGAQRGTSRREDVLDIVIGLRRPADYRAQDGARFEVVFEKHRGLYGDSVSPFEAALVLDKMGCQTWATKDAEESRERRVQEMTELGMKPSEIADELGCNRATVYRSLQRIKDGKANGAGARTDS